MTEDDILQRVREELDKNGGERRPACEQVAEWVGDNTNRLKAFWERFGTRAVIAIEADHQTDVRLGEEGDEWEPPEGHGTSGRAKMIEEEGPDRIIAFRGKRVRIGQLTGEDLIEWGEEQIQHGKSVVRTGKMYREIGEAAGERTLAEAWEDLEDEHRSFLTRRSEPGLEAA